MLKSFYKFFLLSGLFLSVHPDCFCQENGFPYLQNSGDFTVSEKNSQSNEGAISKKFSIVANDVSGDAEITTVSTDEDGEMLVDSQIYGVKMSFHNRPAPYGGQLTRTIDCPTKKFLTEKLLSVREVKTKVVLAVASSRKIHGICSYEEVKFVTLLWTGYDKKNKQVASLRLFRSVSHASKIEKYQYEMLKLIEKNLKR